MCLSVAWDWMFKGVTSDGINREVSSILECARLNQNKKILSLAIPERGLITLAHHHMGMLEKPDSHMSTRSKAVIKGILPSLQFVIERNLKEEEAKPDAWQDAGMSKLFEISHFLPW